MPGIVGIISNKPRALATEELRRMLASMRHESFYVSGTWIDEELGLYAGWVEREEACSGEMPPRNETGDKILLFSGDEFSDPWIARHLKQRGHDVKGGPHAHLVHQAEEDPRFPIGLNGQFQGLLADRARKTLTLFNDRYGMRRLYYHEAADAFYFAAEAKALLIVRPELRVIDEQSLGELVACGCTLIGGAIESASQILDEPGCGNPAGRRPRGFAGSRPSFVHPQDGQHIRYLFATLRSI